MTEANEQNGHWARRAIRSVGDVVRSAAVAQVSRVRVASDRRTAMELKGLEWARTAIDEGARLTKASLEYNVQLAAVARTLTLDAWRSILGAPSQSTSSKA
jgi:hypothetical protein